MLYKGILFKNKQINTKKLISYGFCAQDESFEYRKTIMDGAFEVIISIDKIFRIDTKVIEISTNSEYAPVYYKNADGKFVGRVKAEFEQILEDIAEKCTDFGVFRSEYAYRIIDYIGQKYTDLPEYLWEKFPNNAIFREKKKQKWYAAILTVTKAKFLGTGEGEIEVINLKANPEFIEKSIDNRIYFPAYHMNKKHWYSIWLDDSIPFDLICKGIDESYKLIG